jgi:hypothetical protein
MHDSQDGFAGARGFGSALGVVNPGNAGIVPATRDAFGIGMCRASCGGEGGAECDEWL